LGALAGLMGNLPAMGAGGDMIDMMCKVHDGVNPLGLMVESIFGPVNGPGPDEKCMKDNSGGSGPFKANYTEDASLPNHTIYAPKSPPANEKLPVIVWGNGFCSGNGKMFYNFLNELSSYGFLIISNGKASLGGSGKENYKDLITSIDWVKSNPAVKKYGNVDTNTIIASGQSCGGAEASQASATDSRINMTILFNAVGSYAAAAAKSKRPVAYFLGGPKDMAQTMGDRDFKQLPNGVPSLKASIDIGHIGSYYQKNAGKMGKAATAFLRWKLKGDKSQRALFCNPSAESTLVKAGFKIETKGGIC